MKIWKSPYWKILKKTVVQFFEDSLTNYSSSIAFYLIFSLPAILLITVSIAESAYEDEVVRQTLLEQIRMLLGTESASAVDNIMSNAGIRGSSLFAKFVGIGTLLFSATTVFVSLQDGLNKIWRVKPKPQQNLWNFVKNRMLTLAMVISIGFLLLVSLIIDAIIVIFSNLLTQWVSDASMYIISGINILVSIAIITLVFSMIFKFLPDVKIKWKDVWVGAFVTTLLFTIGKYLIGFYLGNSSIDSVYGTAGSLVLLLIWVYYSSVIIFLGAEFTYVYSKERGERILPDDHAMVIEEVEKEHGIANE